MSTHVEGKLVQKYLPNDSQSGGDPVSGCQDGLDFLLFEDQDTVKRKVVWCVQRVCWELSGVTERVERPGP